MLHKTRKTNVKWIYVVKDIYMCNIRANCNFNLNCEFQHDDNRLLMKVSSEKMRNLRTLKKNCIGSHYVYRQIYI